MTFRTSPFHKTQIFSVSMLTVAMLGSFFLLLRCSPPGGDSPDSLPQPRTSQVITPEPSLTQELSHSQTEPDSPDSTPTPDSQSLQEQPAPRFPLPENYQLLQVTDMNLDYDHTEEQILIARDTESDDMRLRLLIGDHRKSDGPFQQVWEGPIGADLYRGLNIYVEDVIGNQVLEIVCRGMTSEGEQTMDILRRRSPGKGEKDNAQAYHRVLSLTADGSIEIQKVDRSSSYESGQTSGASFPVITTRTDPESDNPMDLIKQNYLWQPKQGRYELVRTSREPAGSVQAKQLRQIYAGGVSTFMDYLDGAWYRVQKNSSVPRELIYFNKKEEKIYFFQDKVQEVYQWKWVRKPLYNKIRLRADNLLLPSINKFFSIDAEDLDTLSLSINYFIKDDQEWDGEYRRLNRELQRIILQQRSFEPLKDPALLTGVFKSNSGAEINFTPPEFQMEQKDKTLSGGYSIFELNKTILELKAKKPNGRIDEVLHFEMSYQTREDELRRIRTLYLYPVILRSSGAYRTDNTMIRFEQIEMKEEEKKEN